MPTPIISNLGGEIAIRCGRGDALAFTVTIKENGTPANISGRTYVATLRDTSGTVAATATCTIVNAGTGVVSVAFSAASTASLVVGATYRVRFAQTASGITEELLRGDVDVYEGTGQ